MSRGLRGLLHVLQRFLFHQSLLFFHFLDLFFNLVLALIIQDDVHVLHKHSEYFEILHGKQIFKAVENVLLREKAIVGEELAEGPENRTKLDLLMSTHNGVGKYLHDKFLVVTEYLESFFHLFPRYFFLIGRENQTVSLNKGLDGHLPVCLGLEKLDKIVHIKR